MIVTDLVKSYETRSSRLHDERLSVELVDVWTNVGWRKGYAREKRTE